MARRFNLARRRLTAQQRERLLARYHRGGFTQREFAAREGIGLSTLVKWLQQECSDGPASVKFQEMVLPSTAGGWAVEVVHPRGWIVRLARVDDAQSLSPLLGALPC